MVRDSEAGTQRSSNGGAVTGGAAGGATDTETKPGGRVVAGGGATECGVPTTTAVPGEAGAIGATDPMGTSIGGCDGGDAGCEAGGSTSAAATEEPASGPGW